MPKAIFKRGVNRLLIWAKKNSNFRLSRHQSDHRAVAAATRMTLHGQLARATFSSVQPAALADQDEAILLDNNQEVDDLVALKSRDQIAVTGNRRVIDFRLVGSC